MSPHIVDALKNHYNNFVQIRDAVGKHGLSMFFIPKKKRFSCIWYVSIWCASREYVRVGESIAIKCVKQLCNDLI